ncbi:hypothetical protein NW064_01340 [Mycoplasmopsis felis]|uniref:hypothetical protein n=1 Tax=Mycoplasmopsis felis TaxID=33923 RepID=UPI0021AFE612|nr:hypothetical protein [Mycoplasmopsis felis]UWW01067.1 hypothetical protein NW064_01340 [Mycoplasmopsis felis]
MTNLEKKDFLTKPHFSSGRIPTPKGLNYYANYLSITYEQKFLTQLNAKLSRKNDDIDLTVEQAVKVITEMTDFTIVTKSSVKLKNIQLVPLDETKVTVISCIYWWCVFQNYEYFTRYKITRFKDSNTYI